MNSNPPRKRQNSPGEMDDRDLLEVAQLLYPSIKGISGYEMCEKALLELRSQPGTEHFAKCMASDPVVIAHLAIVLTIPPVQPNQFPNIYWRQRLERLIEVRKARLFSV